MGLVLLGLSHHTAPLDLREHVVYSVDDALQALRRLRAEAEVPQALLLSTCNRTEVYALARDADGVLARLRDAIFADRLADYQGDKEQLLYQLTGDEAVAHLYRVACGLDSMVLGEQQILAQVKNAYDVSQRAQATGSVLHRLVNGAVRVGKRARTETKIGHGSVSVASTAVELAEKVFGDLKGSGALLIGAGENGRLCAQHLLSREVEPLLIANRTGSKAEALAAELGGEVVAFGDVGEALDRVDVVVSTTGAQEPVLCAAKVRPAMKARDQRAMVLLDIAVPRDIDPDVDGIANVFRFDMDALRGIMDQSFSRRKREVPVVERLVENEVGNFMRWWATLDAGPTIRDLHASFERIRAFELEKNAKRFPNDRQEVETFSKNLTRKLLMGVTREIKQYRKDDPRQAERLAALRQMFQLDPEEAEELSTDEEE
jgi:glutamyl-tRNA reductase